MGYYCYICSRYRVSNHYSVLHPPFAMRRAIVLILIQLFLQVSSSSRPALHSSFLPTSYNVVEKDQFPANRFKEVEFFVRNVPGDGSCLFHALSVCLRHKLLRSHGDFDSSCRKLSRRLRKLACDVMCGSLGTDARLIIEDGIPPITCSDLQDIMAEKYNQTFHEYVDNMRYNASAWGGGPEIIAISNYLQCPIHVYELCIDRTGKEFMLTPKALFGSPAFDSRLTCRSLQRIHFFFFI